MKAPKEKVDVYFNGNFIGSVPNADKFIADIKKRRRHNILPDQINVAYNQSFSEIRINSDSGRARRPLIVVEAGKPRLTSDLVKKLETGKITWTYLLKHGIIEYLDAEEEENAYISIDPASVTKEHTHLELNPILVLGISASLTPYSEYNRGDRVNYGAKMVGQAIGAPVDNFLIRADTKFNILAYPQRPLVRTKTDDILSLHPYGQNVVIAIMCWDGFNMNDAVVLNKSSVERGMFRSFYFRTYETFKKRYWGGQEDRISIPEPGIKGYRGDEAYKDLAEDGIINIETPVQSDSILVGKTSPLRFLTGGDFTMDIENKRESSITVRHGEKGVVDKVLISETTNGEQLLKIRIRDQRIPELGDKFATRHGQKGVTALVVPHEDMPFTKDGVVPDVVFNPHGIPSRMTVSQLIEVLAGKCSAYSGKIVDGSTFSGTKEDEIRKEMLKMGFRDDGKETLYDGRTGKAYQVMIFTGITYYMKLDHMVADKIHARSKGPVTLLTRQPTEGRSKRGGLRLGEMEQQCLVGHGAAMTLKERFNSDETVIPICQNCGLIAVHDKTKNKTHCLVCKDSKVLWVNTSYAFKLTLDEFKSMGVYPKLVVEEI
ncbi:MAG: DNA-directed RNA polymerase subunit B [Candidatus Aenigmarchaeota archaeon]|nr:DNA-directed RNA polymerase subunit B [Candidatus Aenigmarchaeota archaeon]